MPLLDPEDFEEMEADLADVREDNEVSITIRRGNTTLPPQKVRIAGSGSGANAQGRGGEQAVGEVTILGDKTLDIKPQDRFTSGALLYEVYFIRVNRRVAKMANARMIQ